MKKANAPDEERAGGGGGPNVKGKSSGGGSTPKEGSINTPDTSVLARYSPTEGAQSHPDWIKKKFPTYIEPHGMHDATSVRELTHNGHVVRIITTYRVEVDGKPAGMHLSVDEDGQVYTHATPFVTYASAVDLMKEVMDAYPDAFSDDEGDEAQGGHAHGHGQAGEGEQS
ncbi:MAG TPA: hypothetical protein VHB01_08305 [Nitrosospira sp.]|nr:hypothetical protein [Nitrosospira sp.]